MSSFCSYNVMSQDSCFYLNSEACASTRSSHRRCSIKKVFLKILPNLQENTCGTGVFLSSLQIFYEHFFYRTPAGDCY